MKFKKLLGAIFLLAVVFAACTGENHADSPGTNEETAPEEATYPEFIIETTNDDERIYETLANYMFIPDDEIIGEWVYFSFCRNYENYQAVDFDNETITTQTEDGDEELTFADFVNHRPENHEEFYLEKLKFFDNGTVVLQFDETKIFDNSPIQTKKWTKGYILYDMPHSDIVPAYIMTNIGNDRYIFIEWKDFYVYGGRPGYLVYKKTSNRATFDIGDIIDRDIRNLDLSFADFTDMREGFVNYWFNERTIFPPRDRMPKDDRHQPEYILEAGKNPGLGVRAIHERGITGKGVNVAIIDVAMSDNHPEYDGKIIEYVNFSEWEHSFHGPFVTSLLVGESIGTAPGAKVYYYSVERYIDRKSDASAFAEALDMIVEKNKTLPESEKIKVASISATPTPLADGYRDASQIVNGEKYLASYRRATESGILVLDASLENGIIGAARYDFSSPEDITLCQVVGYNDRAIFAPMAYRTTSAVHSEGDYSYQYMGFGGLSSAIPWAAGVLALGWQVSPELTADEILRILMETAYVDHEGYKFIFPAAFIDYLQNY